MKYDYDLLGRLVKVTTTSTRFKDLKTGQTETVAAETKYYYDATGNKTKATDANNHSWEYTYSARGLLLSEKDPKGNLTRYRYDPLGNKIAVIDPRNHEFAPVAWYSITNGQVTFKDPRMDRTFTTWYMYDKLNRLTKTILPDKTPPVNPYSAEEDNPYTQTTYYADGNKETERDITGLVTSFTYTPRGWVESVSIGGDLKARYLYDAKGKRKEVQSYLDASNYTSTANLYDSLGRLRQVTYPGNIIEKYTYDAVGNRKTMTAGTKHSTTVYEYNSLGWLAKLQDPLLNATEYWYDANGNQVAQISPNRLKTVLSYDELNRLQVKKDSLGNLTKFSYDGTGNRWKMQDPRGTEWSYQYYDDNSLQKLTLTGADGSVYSVSYQYDAAGNRTQAADNGNINHYSFDELSRLTEVERRFDEATYKTGYQYTNHRLSGMMYPEAKDWLRFNYNSLNQLNEVVGFTIPDGIKYDGDGAVKGITYQNGVTIGYEYDSGRRLMDLLATVSGKEILKNHYQYWENSANIKNINDKAYYYDANNQLIKAVTPGMFLEDKITPGSPGVAKGDILGTSGLAFGGDQRAIVSVDTNSTSIGLDFGTVAPGIKKILFVPDRDHMTHRVTRKTFDLFVSEDNQKYNLVARDKWEYARDGNGIITITLKERLATRYLKIHVWYDDRKSDFGANDKASFLNELAKMLQVYQEAESRTEEYQYDPVGNRTLTKITLVRAELNESLYYANSDRLKTNGKFAFKYDAAGNLVEKGNKYTIAGDNVTFTETSGEGVEYWFYKYDLLNRLVEVKKNGTVVSEYEYDPEGLRVVKKANGQTIHYVFEGTEPVYEKNVTTGARKSYVFALGKHLARVDGVIGDTEAEKYWYSTDHLGSIKAVTDDTGVVVFQADHLAFGQRVGETGEFEEWHSFTGKEFDPDTGLYYFNARWYDQEIGRFITEDFVNDPNNPNLYTYVANNPLKFTDPTGNDLEDFDLFTPSTWFNSHQVEEVFSDVQTDISGLTISMTNTYEYDSSRNLVSTTLNQTMEYRNGNKLTISTETLAGGAQSQSWTLTTADGKTTTGTIDYDPTTAEQKNLVGIEGFFGINQEFGAIMVATDREGVIGFFKGSTLPQGGTKNILGLYTGEKVIDPGQYRMVSWHHGGTVWNYDNAIKLRNLDGSGEIPTNMTNATGVNIHASTNTKRASSACQNIYSGGESNPTRYSTVSDAEIHEHWPNYAEFQDLMCPHTSTQPIPIEQFIGYYYLYRM